MAKSAFRRWTDLYPYDLNEKRNEKKNAADCPMENASSWWKGHV